MSMKRTINGYTIKKEGESKLNIYRQTTDRQQRMLLISAENSARTIANRSAETLARQQRSHLEKAEAQKLAKELEQQMNEIQDGGRLQEKMLASFEENGIDVSLTMFEKELQTLSKCSEQYLSLQGVLGLAKMKNVFNEFLYNLALKHPKFICYLPSDCFTHAYLTPLPLNELDAQDLSQLEARFESEKLFENSIFNTRYTKYFPRHVAELTKIADISFALSMSPECFNKLDKDGGLRRGFFQNPNPLASIIKRVPKVLMYLTKEELYLFADNFTAMVGRAIAKCPEVLSGPNLDNAFFKTFKPKFIFSAVNKTELKPVISQYFGKLPILEEFFGALDARRVGPPITI